jgi:hypothetical protein
MPNIRPRGTPRTSEALETAVGYAKAGKIPTGLTLADMEAALAQSQKESADRAGRAGK